MTHPEKRKNFLRSSRIGIGMFPYAIQLVGMDAMRIVTTDEANSNKSLHRIADKPGSR
jgi:hypothetical protein